MKIQAKITNAQKALIHVAKAKLGLSDEDYRDALAAHGGGATSSKGLNQEQFKMVMKHFEKCGFRQLYNPRCQGTSQGPEIRALPKEKQGVMALIGQTLAKIGKDWAYAGGIAARMFGVERLEWCAKEELQKVLAALVYQQRKESGARRPKRREAAP